MSEQMEDLEKTKKYKIKGKKKTKKQKKKSKVRKIIKISFFTILFLILILGGIFAAKIYNMCQEAKLSIEDIIIEYENSVVKDIKGDTIAVLNGEENREIVELSEMSTYLPKAFVAIEDERFYEHNGFDTKRTLAATAKFALSKVGIGSSSYGGSTITQQLIKNVTEEDERTWERKVKEIARAYYLEQELSKTQILELYLNIIFLGGQTYGVEIASTYYFNKNANDLTLAESAFLAGINNAPNSYEAFSEDEEDIERIKSRTKIVLTKMYELGQENPNHQASITKEEYDEAIAEVEAGLKFEKGVIAQNVYSYHTDAAINQVIDELMEKNGWNYEYASFYVKNSGLTIYTTQNSDIQKDMEEEVKKSKYQITTKNDKGETCNSQAAMVLIDHKTGYVLATVGGLGEKNMAFGLNRATQSKRQTGSSMKPLAVLVPGIDTGIITAGTSYDDIYTNFGNYPVKNSTGYKGLVTVRYAVASSQNVPMVAALRDIGIDTSIKYLQNMGISSLVEQDKYLGLALGGLTYGISPLEMAAAYACIANDGVYIEPTFYTKVVDSNGNVVLETSQETRTVMSSASAYIIKDILTQVVKTGTSPYCAISGMSVAAKTGTTNDDCDRWLCGFTPYYTAAVWFGYDEMLEIKWSGNNPAGQIWSNVMKKVHEGLESASFASSKPSGLVTATICKSSGLLATDLCKNDPRGSQVYTEYFIKGTAPTKTCESHVEISICEDTGLLATEYCPNVTKKVFITRNLSNNSWKSANDAKYTLTEMDTCPQHIAPVVVEPEPETKPDPGTPPETNPDKKPQINKINTNHPIKNDTDVNDAAKNNVIVNEIVNNIN